MFKTLKTKIAEESKRIQDAVVNQVGEGLNSLTSSKRNELSETSTVKGSPNKNDDGKSKNNTSTDQSSPLIDIFSDSERPSSRQSSVISDSFVSAASSSSFMQEADGELTPVRVRHDSASSIGSVENFFPSVPSGSGRLAPIPSDIETDVESVAGSSSFVTGASREQISSVLTKLQGRAANYKDKYRQLVVSFKEISKENEKIRNVLTTSQDKALRRIQELKEERKLDERAKREMEENLRAKLLSQDGMIATLRHQVQLLKDGKPADDDVLNEVAANHPPTAIFAEREKVKKLEELLSRCKDSIKSYKEKIQTLSNENQELKKKLNDSEQEHQGNAELNDFTTGRAVEELKTKLKQTDDEWKRKLHDETETNALKLAQCKQEMHVEIEKKDQTIEELRQLIKTADQNSHDLMETYKNDLEKAKETERILEQEKKDLLQEVSRSKQAAINVVKEEEDKKREQLQKKFDQQLNEKLADFEKNVSEIRDGYERKLADREKEFELKLKEREEQMNLAIEERDLQKMAALAQHDEKNDRLQEEIEVLKTEKLQFESVVAKTQQENVRHLAEATQNIEKKLKSKHESEISQLESEKISLEQEINELRKEFAASRDEFRHVVDQNDELRRVLDEKNDELQRLTIVVEGSTNDNVEMNENLKNVENTLRLKEEDLNESRKKFTTIAVELENVNKDLETKNRRCEFMEKELQRVLDEKRSVEADFKERFDQLLRTKTGEAESVQKQLEDVKNVEINALTNELERLKQEFAHREESLKQELQQRGDELMFSRDSLNGKDETLANLRKKLDEKTSRLNSLTETNEKLDEQLRRTNAERTEFETKVEQLKNVAQQVADLNMQLEDGRTRIKNLEQEKLFVIEEKNMQIKEANEMLGALEDAVELYRKQLEINEKESKTTAQRLMKDARFQITERDTRLDDMRERVSDLEDAVEIYKSKHSENRVEIAVLREKLQNLIRDGFFLSSEKDLRINELVDKINELDTAVEDYQKQNDLLKKHCETLNIELKRRNDDESSTVERVSTLQTSLDERETKLKTNENELNDLRVTLERNKTEMSFVIGALIECIGEVGGRIGLTNFYSENKLKNAPLDEVKEEIVRFTEDLTSELEENKKISERYQSEHAEFREKLKRNDMLIVELREETSKTRQLLETTTNEKETIVVELETAKNLAKSYETTIDELNSSKNSVDSSIQELLRTVENEQTKNAELAKQLERLSDVESGLQKALDENTEAINLRDREILNLQRQLAKADDVYRKSDDETKFVAAELNETRVREQKLTDQIKTMKENVATIETEMESLKTVVASANDLVDDLRTKLNDAERKVVAADETLTQERERLNQDCESRVADYKKKAETKLSQIKKLLENDKDALNQRIVDLENELKTKNDEFESIRRQNESNDSKMSNQLKETAIRSEEEKQLAVDECRNEYENKIREMTDDHNNKVKQLAKEFQIEMARKETEWQAELSSAFNKTDEDRQRVTKEYQKEMKDLYKDLQEKSQKIEELKRQYETEKSDEISSLKEDYEKLLREKEEQFKTALKQRQDELTKQHKQELEGLTQEWNVDRRNLELQAQIAQGDVQIESPLYLKQRVKQLESQLEALKEKQKRETEQVIRGNAHNSDDFSHTTRHNNERLSSVSLDYTNPVFCEPTEAEYLRNIVFRYMVERESLGKESVTLAKAIAAVLKLSLDQTKEVLAKEEARLSTW